MELTLKRLLEHAEFKKYRGKGYDPTEVDDFLDRAAAMAGKVEVQLTQALEKAKAAPEGGAEPTVDIEAEVERRVAERLAAAPSAPSGPTEDETAEEVRRTLIMAQRTADAAVREAKEDAEQIVSSATERAQTMVAEAEARAHQLDTDSQARAAALDADTRQRSEQARAEIEAEATRERREARQRLAAEISELEGLRESLRSDVNVLERHVEEQRSQLGSTLAELQQILDDPSGFRMAPAPALIDPPLPDFSDLDEPAAEPAAAEPTPAAETEDPAPEPDEQAPSQPEAEAQPEPEPEAEAQLEADPDPEPEPEPVDVAEPADDADDFALPEPSGSEEPPRPPTLSFSEVDHAVPGLDEPSEGGPPTAPVSIVDLDVAAPESAPGADGDDAFLAELRKAMSDDEPLGPRDEGHSPSSDTLFEDDDRRGWRFGRRR